MDLSITRAAWILWTAVIQVLGKEVNLGQDVIARGTALTAEKGPSCYIQDNALVSAPDLYWVKVISVYLISDVTASQKLSLQVWTQDKDNVNKFIVKWSQDVQVTSNTAKLFKLPVNGQIRLRPSDRLGFCHHGNMCPVSMAYTTGARCRYRPGLPGDLQPRSSLKFNENLVPMQFSLGATVSDVMPLAKDMVYVGQPLQASTCSSASSGSWMDMTPLPAGYLQKILYHSAANPQIGTDVVFFLWRSVAGVSNHYTLVHRHVAKVTSADDVIDASLTVEVAVKKGDLLGWYISSKEVACKFSSHMTEYLGTNDYIQGEEYTLQPTSFPRQFAIGAVIGPTPPKPPPSSVSGGPEPSPVTSPDGPQPDPSGRPETEHTTDNVTSSTTPRPRNPNSQPVLNLGVKLYSSLLIHITVTSFLYQFNE